MTRTLRDADQVRDLLAEHIAGLARISPSERMTTYVGDLEAILYLGPARVASKTGQTEPKSVAQLLRGVLAADPEAHDRALARGYGVGEPKENDVEPDAPFAPPTCSLCRRARTLEGMDAYDYNPIQVVTGQPLGWYSDDDGEMCPECMTKMLRNQ